MEKRFENFKSEILKRAKKANACRPEYGKACSSETFSELMQVIKDNFNFATQFRVIEPEIIEMYIDEFNANQIYCNMDVSSGFMLAYGSATVKAYDSATVEAYGSATVEAYGSVYVTSYWIMECKLYNNAIYRIREKNVIRYASDSVKFEKV